MPAAPPAMASRTLSVSSWRTSRPRPAPSATRTASSLRRDSVRDSSAPVRFAQAMSSTSAALVISTSSGVRVSPTIQSRSGIAVRQGRVVARVLAREDRPIARARGARPRRRCPVSGGRSRRAIARTAPWPDGRRPARDRTRNRSRRRRAGRRSRAAGCRSIVRGMPLMRTSGRARPDRPRTIAATRRGSAARARAVSGRAWRR